MANLKILQVCGASEGGSWFIDQVTALVARGYEVVVVTPGAGSVSRRLRAQGLTVHEIPFRGYRPTSLPTVLRAVREIRRISRSGGFDLVHAHLLKASVVCRVALRGQGPRLVSQAPSIMHLENRWLRWIDRLTMRWDGLLLASCTEFAKRYRELGARKTAVSFYGCDTSQLDPEASGDPFRTECGLPDGTTAVGMIAHMYPTRMRAFAAVGVKGHETFIDAARKVAAIRDDVRFFVVGDEFAGDGSYRTALELRASDLVAQGLLSFLGHRSDIQTVLAGMDILVNPSLSESASYTMIEASLMRRPVVATAVGGLLDTVRHEETGLLVPPADPGALAAAIDRLVGDPGLRDRLGSAGRMHVEALFNLTATVDSVEAAYAIALGGPR